MKKRFVIFTACVLLLSMVACGEGDAQQTTPGTTVPAAPNVEVPEDPGYVFGYNGTQIPMKAEAQPILEALGEPKSYTETASCAFVGLDKTYFYGSFYLTTCPIEDKDYIYGLWLVDDTVTTAEGLYIGASQADVERIYGTEGYNGSNGYILTKGACRLTIILEEGLVSSIQYDAVF